MKIKCKISTLILVLSINIFSANAQVGFGTNSPDQSAVIDMASTSKGVLIPRMTQAQRNSISSPTNGLMIYNIDEGCFDYYSSVSSAWVSLCGLGGATFTCNGTPTAMGIYKAGSSLGNLNYLSVPVSVIKPGTYTIIGTTTNGYNFYSTGTILQTGNCTITAMGQGTPTTSSTDNITISINGSAASSCGTPTVTVGPPTATYTMTCGSAIVKGTYIRSNVLTSSNYISLKVNVTATGSWSIRTNTVSGISFSGSGNFNSTGIQTIKLYGTGTPNSVGNTTLSISSDNINGVVSTCSVTVLITLPKLTIYHYGSNTYNGYSYAPLNMLDATTNFGPAGIVQCGGFVHSNPSVPTSALGVTDKPDIVIIGYGYNPSVAEVGYLTTYLNAGGVLIDQSEDPGSSQNLLRSIFNSSTLTVTNGAGGGGSIYLMPSSSSVNDQITNGPFGNVSSKFWGEDRSQTCYISTNIPTGITVYTSPQSSQSTNVTGVTMFKHNTLNFFWVGDGGFIGSSLTATGINTLGAYYYDPFQTNASYFPIGRTNYGSGTQNGYTTPNTVYNAVIFGNIMAWAVQQALDNGINNY